MKDKILNAALEQINRVGVRKFTVDEVASQLGISRKTIYTYFNNKAQIISASTDKMIEINRSRVNSIMDSSGTWLEKLSAILLDPEHDSEPLWVIEEMRIFFPEEWSKFVEFEQVMRVECMKLLKEGVSKEEIRPDINLSIVNLLHEKMILSMFDYDFLIQNNLSLNQAIEETKKVFLFGIMRKRD